MKCPVCKTEEMIILELKQVEIDYCPSCAGIWLDQGELELLWDPDNTQGVKDYIANLPEAKGINEEKRKCPICNKTMFKALIGEEKQTLIDKCPKYHGIWLDAGELEEILSNAKNKDSNVVELLRDMFGSSESETF